MELLQSEKRKKFREKEKICAATSIVEERKEFREKERT